MRVSKVSWDIGFANALSFKIVAIYWMGFREELPSWYEVMIHCSCKLLTWKNLKLASSLSLSCKSYCAWMAAQMNSIVSLGLLRAVFWILSETLGNYP